MKIDFGKLILLAIFLSIFGLSGLIWPLIIFSIIFSSISKKKTKTEKKQSKKEPDSTQKNEQNLQELKAYFETHQRLELSEQIVLQTEGAFQLENCMVYQNQEQVATLQEFKKYFPATYEDLLEQCVLSIQNTHHQPEEKPVEKKISELGQFIERIHELNAEINEEEISNGLYEAVLYLKQIDAIVKEFPDAKKKTKKLVQYYLPSLIDILQSYQQLSKAAHQHEEFAKSEQRLKKTIVLINEAMKTIRTSLTQEYFMDLSVEMTTLEALLKKDGLVEEGTLNSVRNQVKTNAESK